MRWLMVLPALLALPLSMEAAGPFRAGGNLHDGEAITCDLPVSEHLKNGVGRDGLGLCVFTSLDHAARWCNEPALIGFRDFMTQHPGGGWPEKVDEYLPRCAKSKGLPTPDYLQHTGGDAEFLRRALKTGRYVCVTYNGSDGVFYRRTIAHMVNLVHLSEKWAVIHDSNYPGQWLWMPPADFLERWRGSGGGWAIVLLKAGPPPIPVNVRFECVAAMEESTTSLFETNFGLHAERISRDSCYRFNGKIISQRDAYAAVGILADDSHRLRLTIVGDDAFRRKVRDDLAGHRVLAKWRDRLLVQDYPLDHWAVSGVGFASGIVLQPPADADGKAPVLFRMTSYSGPEILAGAIRKADPNYRPELDPDPARLEPQPIPVIPTSKAEPPPWIHALYVLGGCLVALLIVRRREKS